MISLELGLLARAAGARSIAGVGPAAVTGVATDSRTLAPGSLFVALRGERYDGHDFLVAARERGAVAAVVDAKGEAKALAAGLPLLVVPDTLRALGDMANAVRLTRSEPVVAVGGSNGKTTTKELIAAALGVRGAVHRTRGNLNNLIGLPLTLLEWPASTWAAVIEAGMNMPGELARLTDIAAPTLGILTVIGPEHLEGLGTVENVARAEGELFLHLPEHATCVVNADDELIESICVPLAGKRRQVSFGHDALADVQVLSQRSEGVGQVVELRIERRKVEISLPLAGAHNATNAAGAAAVAWALGLTDGEIARGLAAVTVPGSRMRIVRDTPRGVSVLDDTYNANPQSMKAAFAALSSLASGRKLAVLGDMFELGAGAPGLHREVGEAAARSGITHVLALGPCAEETAMGARAGGASGVAYADVESLVGALDELLVRGDWLVVKGSRGMRMERVVEHVTQSRGASGH